MLWFDNWHDSSVCLVERLGFIKQVIEPSKVSQFLASLFWVHLCLNTQLIAIFLRVNRSPSKVPRIVLPNELFINAAKSVGAEVNLALGFLQDVACGGNLKQFVVVFLIAIIFFKSFQAFLSC